MKLKLENSVDIMEESEKQIKNWINVLNALIEWRDNSKINLKNEEEI
ncbi:hypothetical protein [Methanobacterium sp. SMA-27]|nr:hypothetical protein [Methanobacterium sp. SMA-27]